MELSTHKVFPREICSDDFLDALTITNPEYFDAQRLGLSTKDIPQYLKLYMEKNGKVYVPRAMPNLPQGVSPKDLVDRRVEGTSVAFSSKVNLHTYQVPAVKAMVNGESGILEAPCGTGKTVMGLEAACRIGKATLVLVHKGFLMEQWAERIREFLGEEAGFIQGSTWNWRGKKIVVAMLQTLYSQRETIPEDFRNYFGLVITDECHRVSAPTWAYTISMFPAKRRLGLTATAKRADRLEIIFHAHLGEILYSIEGQELKPSVYMVKTGLFVPTNHYYNKWNQQPNMPKLITAITKLKERNIQILRHLVAAAKAGRKILLLTDRVEHAKHLKESFEISTSKLEFTTSLYIGATDSEGRKLAEEADVIFATSQIAKEGLDIKELDTLFLVTPSGSEVTIQQSVGRILRVHHGKKNPLVLDFIDEDSICIALARKRARVYGELGYDVRTV